VEASARLRGTERKCRCAAPDFERQAGLGDDIVSGILSGLTHEMGLTENTSSVVVAMKM
jgi:hypothetical protein